MSGTIMPVSLFRSLGPKLSLNLALGHDKAQNIIDQITASYESTGGPPPGGFGFGPQHLGAPPPNFGPPSGFSGPMPPPMINGGA